MGGVIRVQTVAVVARQRVFPIKAQGFETLRLVTAAFGDGAEQAAAVESTGLIGEIIDLRVGGLIIPGDDRANGFDALDFIQP